MAANRPVVEFGLTEVASVPDPAVDVVFVHGLNGHPQKTWSSDDVFWPRDLLPAAVTKQQCRILTYGYDANVTAFTDGTTKDHIHHHAETLAARLDANRGLKDCQERPLIFVCHSLGGLVVKRMLIYCEESSLPGLRATFVSTYGILFLGTPHTGSDIAKWGSLLQKICSVALPKKFFDTSPQLVRALETKNDTLQNINRQFTELALRFKIYFFHEAKPTNLKGTLGFIVEEDSAAPDLPKVQRAGIEKDHSHMCKFHDEYEPGYDVVSYAIKEYARDAPGTIVGRWAVEHRNQDLGKQDAARELLGVSNQPQQLSSNPPSAQQSQHTSMGAPPNPLMLTGDSSAPSAPYEIEEIDELVNVSIPNRR